jgi:methyl acetate hydrolase
MIDALQRTADQVLGRVVSGSPRVPGVVAMVTDRGGNIYEGATGKRMLGQPVDMTTDCVFVNVFRCTSSPASARRRP